MRRRLRKLLVLLLLAIAGVWFFQKLNIIPTWNEVFKSKPVVIDETPMLVKQIKSIGQLVTATAYDEVVVDSFIATRGSAFVNAFNKVVPVPILPPADKQIVLIAKGKVLAGIDLKLLKDEIVKVVADTVTIILPRAKILDAITNPADFETFIEKGEWTNEAVNAVKQQAKQKMIDRATAQMILEKAQNKAKTVMENFITTIGFAVVNVQ
ncbi:MAG: hypothetical protein JWQ96_2795, partial [Segetibacter sp.]|nr:hypothetical protein [Segetibacter sp.]